MARGTSPRRPAKQAYHEIWLNGEKLGRPRTQPDDEPIYGKVYLPRKFKVGVRPAGRQLHRHPRPGPGLPGHRRERHARRLQPLVGGGRGRRTASPTPTRCSPSRSASSTRRSGRGGARRSCKLFRDHGNRADRKRARLKYVMHDWGVEKFREVFYRDYFPHAAAAAEGRADHRPRPAPRLARQGDGKWFLGLSVSRTAASRTTASLRLRSGLRAIVAKFRPRRAAHDAAGRAALRHLDGRPRRRSSRC